MVRYKYTPEALAQAAAAAHSIAEVMRLLGVRVSGGSHAHISRQLKRFGVDTSHFTGGAHNRGRPSERRTTSAQLLVRLAAGSRRTPGTRLKWALRDLGVPEECEECDTGPIWRGRALTLHVDHISGDFLDNRPPNLRLLCPNCHSQTATYAGRNRYADGPVSAKSDRADSSASHESGSTVQPPNEEDVAALIKAFDLGTRTAISVAHTLDCRLRQVYRLRQRLQQTGSVAPGRRGPRPRALQATSESPDSLSEPPPCCS